MGPGMADRRGMADQRREHDEKFLSSVGETIDVATPYALKLRLLALVWGLGALFFGFLISYFFYLPLMGKETGIDTGTTIACLVLMPLFLWFCLGNAVIRIRASLVRGRYFRAGPGGISVRLPETTLSASLRFKMTIIQLDLPWEKVKTWYPFTSAHQGIVTERSIVFELHKNKRIAIPTFHFREKQKEIAANVARAQTLESLASAVASSDAPIETIPVISENAQPVDFKKKRELVKEVDLLKFSGFNRILEAAGYPYSVLEQIKIYATGAGYSLDLKNYQPFQGSPIPALRITLRRGLLCGYDIDFEPGDTECRKVVIFLSRSMRISRIRNSLAVVTGLGGVAMALLHFDLFPSEVHDYTGQATVLYLLCAFLIAAGLAEVILQIPIGLALLLLRGKDAEEHEKEQLRTYLR